MDALCIAEWEIIEKAIDYKSVDTDYRNHLQAFLNMAVQAKKKGGRPVYERFSKFYNYEEAQKEIGARKQDRFSFLKEYLRKGEKRG